MNGTYYFLQVEDLNLGKRIENRADENLKNFNLNFGFFYLITDTPPVLTYFIMKNRLSTGSQGIFLSDTPEENYRKNFNGDYAIKTMSEFGQNLDATSFYDSILSSMDRIPDKSVILMEKLYSLVLRNGFDSSREFVYRHCSEIAINNSYLEEYYSFLSMPILHLDNWIDQRFQYDRDKIIFGSIGHQTDNFKKQTFNTLNKMFNGRVILCEGNQDQVFWLHHPSIYYVSYCVAL